MEQLNVITKRVDVLPMVKHYIDQLGIYGLFSKYVKKPERSPVDPAQILSVLVANIVCASQPLYKVEQWAADYMDGLSEYGLNASIYNDDQIAKSLDLLFKADRNSFMSELTANAIWVYLLETKQIHNDSTSVTFTGAYENQHPRAVKLKHGFNKDHRPDCKLCSQKNLDHIHEHGGIFITIVPKNRSDVKQFYEFLKTNSVEWQYAYETPSSRKKSENIVYKTYEGEPSKNGYRIIWVHSSAKEKQDKSRRKNRISKADLQLTELSSRLNQYNLKTKEQIEKAIKKATKGTFDLFQIQLIEDKQIVRRQIGPGKPGPNTQYKEEKNISYRLEWELDHKAIKDLASRDGIFPLITNAEMDAPEVLKAYKNQPYLEKRMYTAKSILKVAPVFLKKTERIEAMTFLYFIALMIVSLMERNIRKNMAEQGVEKLPILPNGMNTKKPTWNNLNYFFKNVHLSMVEKQDKIIQTVTKGVTQLHEFVLKLLGVPPSVYAGIQDRWWLFKSSGLAKNFGST